MFARRLLVAHIVLFIKMERLDLTSEGYRQQIDESPLPNYLKGPLIGAIASNGANFIPSQVSKRKLEQLEQYSSNITLNGEPLRVRGEQMHNEIMPGLYEMVDHYRIRLENQI